MENNDFCLYFYCYGMLPLLCSSWPDVHIITKMLKAQRGIGLIEFFKSYLSGASLDKIYRIHVRPHLYYCALILHTPTLPNKNHNDNNIKHQMNNLEEIQAVPGLSTTPKGTNGDKIYEK